MRRRGRLRRRRKRMRGSRRRLRRGRKLRRRRRRRRRSRILTIKDHATEAVRSFKYLGTVISHTNDEQKKSKLES